MVVPIAQAVVVAVVLAVLAMVVPIALALVVARTAQVGVPVVLEPAEASTAEDMMEDVAAAPMPAHCSTRRTSMIQRLRHLRRTDGTMGPVIGEVVRRSCTCR
jgi:hypothetical protein